MTESIKKIEKVTAGDQVYQNIRENIVNGHWKIGDKLPSELELSSLYGVNRLTVRNALQRLNAIGLVETRVGNGTFVKRFDLTDYIQAVSDLYDDPQLMNDVCEFRKLIEIECARLAIKRCTDTELDELNTICSKYEQVKSKVQLPVSQKQLDELTFYDVSFHAQICKMSHNKLYDYCFTMARGTLEKYVNLTLKKRIDGWIEKDISIFEGDFRHRAIYNYIKDRDFEHCKSLYEDMIDYNIEL